MDTLAVKTVKEGFRRFQPSITIKTGNPNDVIKQAVLEDPAIIYYLHSCSIFGSLNGIEIRAQYIHKDTDRADIQMAVSQDECENLMCQYVGMYKKKLIAVVKDNLNQNEIMNSFHEKHSSFYPNLTRVKALNYHSYFNHTVFEFDFEYRIGWVKLAQMEIDVDNEVKRIGDMLFKQYLPSEAKIYLAHNYLATTVEYLDDDDNRLDLSYTQSAYGALIRKQCVCQGFAEAFKRLMDYAGIKCTVIYGHTTGSKVLHAWNLVEIGKNGSYYHIDVTWDAAGDKPGYMYFCKNDIFFNGKRTWNKDFNPKCTGSYPVLSTARRYVYQNKQKLISEGIDIKILDC